MKATLTFDLADPDDNKEHLRCVQSYDICSAVYDFIHNTRKRLTEKAIEKGLDVDDAIFMVYEEFAEILGEHNININKIIY
jgi:signal recognition particle GTPase